MDPYREFCTAVQSGNAVLAASLLREHPEWKDRLDQPLPGGAFGSTALLVAVGRNDREMIDVLLQAGASIDARSDWWAGGFGVLDSDSKVTDFLIKRGATVNVHAAARLGRMERLRELLDRDPALVHAKGGDGQTPLHVAASVEVAALLLDRGADINALDVDHESTPAQYMVTSRPGVARYLITRGCRTDVLLAAALGDLDLVRRHLDASPQAIHLSVTAENFPKRDPRAGGTIYIWTLGWYQTPHLLAHQRGHQAVFDLLLERSQAPLQLSVACEIEDDAGITKLLAAGTAPAPELDYRLPAAAHNNRAAVVGRLLQAGWPVNATTPPGITALHWSAWHGNAQAVRVLLDHGAAQDVRDPDHDGTPLDWARHGAENSWHRARGNYPAVIAMLEAK